MAKTRMLSFMLAVIMIITAAMPVSALESDPIGELYAVEGDTIHIESKSEETAPDDPMPDEGTPDDFTPDEPASDEATDETIATPTNVDETPSLGQSAPPQVENGNFYLDCTPEQAAELIAFYEFLHEQIDNPIFRPFAAPGDSGSVSWTWGESVGIEVPSGDPSNPYRISNIPRITLSTANMPLGRPFCVEFGIDPGGSYTASEGNDSQILALLVAQHKGSASAVGTQLALWYKVNGLPLGSHSAVTAALSAASSVDTTGYTYLLWNSGSGQPFVTLDRVESTGGEPGDGGDDDDDGDEEEPENPNTTTEVTTEETTTTEVRSSTEYEYSDAIGQITITKRDDEGNSLDGAIFRIDIEFADGSRGGTGAFEVYNGSRLFTWTHPRDDCEPAKVTVTEIYCPPGYIMDSTPKTAIVHPTYTRITKVLTHTITITTTTTTTSVIDIDSGEVLAESSASASAETELNPPTVQEYTDFIEGDRETDLTFVNVQQSAELIIFKYRSGTNVPLAGAKFEVSYVDPSVDSGRWVVTTGADGKATIALPKPGAVLIHEVSAPAYHVITSAGPDTTVTIMAGESKQVDIPNDPYTAVEVTKIDSVTGAKLAGATISLKHITSGMEYRQVTDSNGIALFENVEPGSYYAEEIIAPDRYVLNTTRYPVELRSHETAAVTIPNDPYTGIEVTKVDANNGAKLSGAFIRIKHISSGQEYTGETDEDGIVYFGLIPPGDYYVEEIQAPFGYVLNETRYPLELKTGELSTLTLPNYRKDGLYIRKVDENGKPLAGAVFELRRGSGEVLIRETTDANGLIYRGFLSTDTYIIEEISAPVGYLLDENNPQSIYISHEDDNKEYSVTFVNKRKPAIEIIKVDANDPTKRLQGAVFRISEQGGSKTWDVTTGYDGTALLEDLDINTTYLVEEITAPYGYVNSGYREAIVLEECRVHTITVANGSSPKLLIEKIDENNGRKLEGAVFHVARQGSSDYKEVTTGFDGTVTISDLDAGFYTVTEIRAPSGYVLDSTIRNVELIAGQTTTVVVNNSQRPDLTLRKIDAETGEGLAGAVLRVTKDGGTAFQDVTTGKDGIIVISDLAPGWYIVTERQAPIGYILDESPHYIEVKAGEDAELIIQNQRKPSLKITKLDSMTKQPLQYVTFEIQYKNGKSLGEFTTDENGEIFLEDIEPGLVVITETKARDGYIISDESKEILVEWGKLAVVEFLNDPIQPLLIYKVDAKTGGPLSGAKFLVTKVSGEVVGEFETGRNGYITVTGLLPGFFTVKEIKSPLGYILSDTPKTVELKIDQPAIVEFENQPLNGLHILKVDSMSGTPLEGAKFSVHHKGGALVGNYTTNSHGEIAIDGLEPGWYTITETKAPDGYLLDNTPHDVELVWGQFATVEFENRRLASFQIKKVDEADGSPLPGALFRVTTTEGTLVGEFTTSVDGFINVPELAPGSYIVSELRSPDGYSLDNTPKTVVVKANQTAIIEFTNKALPGVQVRKVDAATGEPLAGAKFRVTKMNGELVGDYTTNQAGFFAVSELDTGWYTIFETAAPAGYITDSTPQNVELKPNQTAVVEFANKPLAGLQIKKVDSETGLPLEGVTFEVEHLNGARIGTFTTDEAGLIFIPDLQEGWLVVTETKTVSGYKLDNAPRNVEIISGKLNVFEMTNMPYPYLQIKKVDADTGAALAGVRFKIYDKNTRELGEFATNELGIIKLTGMEPGTYYVKESAALDGYVLDETLREVSLYAGKTTTIEVKNTPLSTLRLKKVDSVTGKPLDGAKFLLRDSKNNIIGEYVSDHNGMIELPSSLPAGKYLAEEITAPDGYVLPDAPVSFELKAGATTEIAVENDPIRGRIQILKKSADKNTITGAKAGAALSGAVFEIVNEKLELVDTITTNERGIAESIDLPLGKYAIQEITAPEHYLLDDGVFYSEVKLHDDVVRFEVLNHSAEIAVTVEKRGNEEALPGDVIRYDFSNVSNASNITLDEFFWHDQLPTDAVRLEKISTGTWSERLTYRVVYRTNLKTEYRVWKSGLLTTVNNELDVSELKLSANEYITDFKLEFGTVEPGFHEVEAPFILTRVLDDLSDEYRFVNKTDVGGKCSGEFVYATDSWVTVVFGERGSLPKTGM
ncbi:hypothetical protein LJC63_01105 [Ruminococcaceae bacterium OttesenSCG-928-L11]|nr:hypothetical protein [Ruminococcaceae bacterium OttesenSCG-928-L11]